MYVAYLTIGFAKKLWDKQLFLFLTHSFQIQKKNYTDPDNLVWILHMVEIGEHGRIVSSMCKGKVLVLLGSLIMLLLV